MTESRIHLEYSLATSKFGFKGPAAGAWLEELGLPLPKVVFESYELGSDGRIVRFGAAEFFLELRANGNLVARLDRVRETAPPGVYSVPRCESTFVLSGADALQLLAQTCGIDFRRAPPGTAIFTRVAGVSCGILFESTGETQYRIWIDYSYAAYLWETLRGIVMELGGTVEHGTATEATAAVV